jgi:DNA polymerase III delta subunit
MIVRQFRILIMFHEAKDSPEILRELVRELRLPSFVAEKMGRQARRFTMPALERVHHYLLDIDEEIKSSQVEPAVVLQTLVVTLTLPD